MQSLLVALDIDGTLIDTTQSFTRIVKELTGSSSDELSLFRATGGFNDDWELARALKAWMSAGRPDVAGLVDLDDLLARLDPCWDPGDMSAAGIALYRSGYWRDERVLVEGAVLRALAARHRVAACTGRDRWEMARAEELLGFTFTARTTMEDAKKPDAHALLRLAQPDEVIVLLGDNAADRMCAERARATGRDVRFVHIDAKTPARPVLERLARTDDFSYLPC